MVKFQPAIKWSGSKRSQSEKIVSKIERKKYKNYYEPFVGGASVLYQVLSSDLEFDNYICSDINKDLIDLWNEIKKHPKDIIESYFLMWSDLNKDSDDERRKEYFNMVRNRFNKNKNPHDFMFIMRTTTNGMPRYNGLGEFNNSFHFARKGASPNFLSKAVYDWSEKLNRKDVQFSCQSYNEIETTKEDFLYLDPPYADTKGMYFGSINHESLWSWMRNQKASYILSFNGKSSNIDLTHDVPKDLYSSHEYIDSGNSSFRRIVGISNKEFMRESLYIK